LWRREVMTINLDKLAGWFIATAIIAGYVLAGWIN
jgi:hypothetical protein